MQCNTIHSVKGNNFPFIVQMCLENDMATTQTLTDVCE